MDSFTKFIVSVGTTILAAGVVGLWTMSTNVGRIEERLSAWTVIFDRRIERMGKLTEDLDKRLDVLEKQRFRFVDPYDLYPELKEKSKKRKK